MIVKIRRGTKRTITQQILGDTVASATWTVTPDTTPSRLGTPTNNDSTSKVQVTVGVTTDIELSLVPHIVGASGDTYEPETPLTIRVV